MRKFILFNFLFLPISFTRPFVIFSFVSNLWSILNQLIYFIFILINKTLKNRISGKIEYIKTQQYCDERERRRSELIDAKGIPRKCQSISNLFNNFDDFPNSDSFALISQHETAHLWEILE
jgi:hypothetical protein